eukprot:291713-Chlamydomonas_euryale.AAC.10
MDASVAMEHADSLARQCNPLVSPAQEPRATPGSEVSPMERLRDGGAHAHAQHAGGGHAECAAAAWGELRLGSADAYEYEEGSDEYAVADDAIDEQELYWRPTDPALAWLGRGEDGRSGMGAGDDDNGAGTDDMLGGEQSWGRLSGGSAHLDDDDAGDNSTVETFSDEENSDEREDTTAEQLRQGKDMQGAAGGASWVTAGAARGLVADQARGLVADQARCGARRREGGGGAENLATADAQGFQCACVRSHQLGWLVQYAPCTPYTPYIQCIRWIRHIRYVRCAVGGYVWGARMSSLTVAAQPRAGVARYGPRLRPCPYSTRTGDDAEMVVRVDSPQPLRQKRVYQCGTKDLTPVQAVDALQ